MTGRKEHPRFAHYQDQVHTAVPEIIDSKLVLLLLMDSMGSMREVDPVMASHELGHWVLKLQGFQALLYRGHEYSSTEILLNSMVQHVPLYELQRSVGHDPQSEIDSHCLHDLKLCSREKEAKSRQSWAETALIFGDDVLNCSAGNRTALMNVVNNRFPNIARIVRTIMQRANSRDLLLPEQNLAFAREVVRCLELPGDWYLADDIGALISMHQGLQDAKSGSENPGPSK